MTSGVHIEDWRSKTWRLGGEFFGLTGEKQLIIINAGIIHFILYISFPPPPPLKKSFFPHFTMKIYKIWFGIRGVGAWGVM